MHSRGSSRDEVLWGERSGSSSWGTRRRPRLPRHTFWNQIHLCGRLRTTLRSVLSVSRQEGVVKEVRAKFAGWCFIDGSWSKA